MYNLVQAEFFHVGRNQNPDLKDFVYATYDRISEITSFVKTGIEPSSRIKTVVRFYDINRVLTSVTLESQRIRLLESCCVKEYMVASPPGRVMLNDLSRRLARGVLAQQNMCKIHAQAMLREAIKLSQPIAVEKADHTFRVAPQNELHEILEQACGSWAVWLFVFEPNELLSDNNKIVASAM